MRREWGREFGGEREWSWNEGEGSQKRKSWIIVS
jgi:hypothetical protein